MFLSCTQSDAREESTVNILLISSMNEVCPRAVNKCVQVCTSAVRGARLIRRAYIVGWDRSMLGFGVSSRRWAGCRALGVEIRLGRHCSGSNAGTSAWADVGWQLVPSRPCRRFRVSAWFWSECSGVCTWRRFSDCTLRPFQETLGSSGPARGGARYYANLIFSALAFKVERSK